MVSMNSTASISTLKLLCFADLHESLSGMRKLETMVRKEMPAVVVCAGDYTVFEQHIEQMMNWLQKLPVPVLLIHGNHEEEAVVRTMCKSRHNITFLHKKLVMKDGVLFVGYGGGGFEHKDPEFERFAKDHEDKIKSAEKVVLVTHGPPHGTKLDHIWGDSVGNKSYAAFLKQHKNAVLGVSGHIHETAGKQDMIGTATVINPGPQGKVIVI